MFKIRPNCFETNSSSMDSYDDYDDDRSRYAKTYQTIRIIFKWDENATDERISEIFDDMLNGVIDKELFQQFDEYFDEPDGEVYDGGDDYLELQYKVIVGVSYRGSYYPATRYSPAEYPEPELDDDWSGVPLKNQPFAAKNQIIENLMKVFKERGWTEIVGIENIYGEDIDYDDAYNNIED